MKVSLAFSAVSTLLATTTALFAAERTWTGDTAIDADFGTAGNWSGETVPGTDDKAVVGSGSSSEAPVVFQTPSWTVKGYTVDNGGGLDIAAGSLVSSAEARIGNAGAGSLAVTGGVLQNAQTFSVGYDAGSSGTFLLTDGFVTNGNYTYIGNMGTGTMTMQGGLFRTTSGTAKGNIYVANAAGSHGELTLSGGTVDLAYQLVVGSSGTGTFTMNGGSLVTSRHGILGNGATGSGTMHLISGELYQNAYDLLVGNYGEGYLVVENTFLNMKCRTLQAGVEAGSCGVVELNGGKISTGATTTSYIGKSGHGELYLHGGEIYGPSKGSVVVRDTENAFGLVRGWGLFSTDGAASHRNFNGVIVADGFGEAHDLDFGTSSYAFPCESKLENTSTNGYYAVGQGRMVIPPYVLQPGTNAVAWCEAQDDAAIDMVNSASFVLDIKAPKKNMEFYGDLYAADRADVPAFRKSQVPIGVWKFTFTDPLNAIDVTVRYDHVAAKGKKVSLLRYDETLAEWVDTEASELDGYRLRTTVSDLGFFATAIPANQETVVIIQ